MADSGSTAYVQDKVALSPEAPFAHPKVASHNEFAYTSATTSNAGTGGNPSAGPSRLPTTFADDGNPSYRSVEAKKKAEVPWWETDIRTHVATMDSEIEQLEKVKEQLDKLKKQCFEGIPIDKKEQLWESEDSHSANIGVARDSMAAPIRAARKEGCTWANMKTIMDEGGENDVREERVLALWDLMSRGSCSQYP